MTNRGFPMIPGISDKEEEEHEGLYCSRGLLSLCGRRRFRLDQQHDQVIPNIEFILLTIEANRSVRGKFVYELPENLTQVYELYLEDWDPAAEWVRLDYGPGSPIFTFTVDLEEERA